MDPPALVRRFQARPEHVAQVRRETTACAEHHGVLDADGLALALALALAEAITNAVLHAYSDAPEPGVVEVVAQRHADDGLRIAVCDDGHGMRPRSASPGAGFGLPLIASLADHFEVRSRPGGGTRLSMTFAAA
jgi:anti-sigma regulatory factor (Ser/Thr protein kinase)